MLANNPGSMYPADGNESNRVKEVMVDTRINKVLALRTDSVVMLEALNSISEFYQTNTPEARRSLRYNLENYNVENGKKFIEEMKIIKNYLESAEVLSNDLNQMCSMLQSKVEKADANMKSFIEKTSTLEKNKNLVISSKNQIEFFLSKYHMNQNDVNFLQSANLDLPSEFSMFFQKLHKLKESFTECQKFAESNNLEVSRTSNATSPSNSTSTTFNTGLIHFELLEVLGNQKENAYLYLFQWIKAKCDLFSDLHQNNLLANNTGSNNNNSNNFALNPVIKTLHDNPELVHKLQIAIAHIKDIPVYFQQCQDLLIPAKRNILINKFMLALTQGEVISDGGSHQKTAIDLQSHDPMAYVGSILAWLHQTIAQEKEYLEAIFNDQFYQQSSNRQSSMENQHSGSAKLNEYNYIELLARIIHTLGKPLRIRLMQTLENHSSLDILYGLADLLLFYEKIFQKLIPTENAIHSCLKGCFNECRNMFRLTLKKQIDNLTNAAHHNILVPNPLQTNNNSSNPNNSTSSSSSSYLDLKVSMMTRENSKLITNILKICCNSLSNLPFESSAEILATESTKDINNSSAINNFNLDVVLSDILQPLLQYCRVQVSKLQNTEMAIYMLNNISFLQNEIVDFAKKLKKSRPSSSASSSNPTNTNSLSSSLESISWESLLSEEYKIWKNILIHEEINFILKKSEFDKLLERIDLLPNPTLLNSTSVVNLNNIEESLGYSMNQLDNILKSFYSILFTISLSSELEKLMNPILREEIRLEISKSVSDSYAKVYRFIADERNGLDRSILGHSIDQVNVLLGNSSSSTTASMLNTTMVLENMTLLDNFKGGSSNNNTTTNKE